MKATFHGLIAVYGAGSYGQVCLPVLQTSTSNSSEGQRCWGRASNPKPQRGLILNSYCQIHCCCCFATTCDWSHHHIISPYIIIECNEGMSYASFADYSPCTSIHTYLPKHLTDLWCSSKISLLPKHISFHVVALHSKWTAHLPHALMHTIQADRRHKTCCICYTRLCPLRDPLTVYTTSITRNNVSWLKWSAAKHHSMRV